MKTLDDYINDAKKRQGIKSDRKLCEALNLSPLAVHSYKNKGGFPNDETMIKLAELGGNEAELALIHLNIWRSPSRVQKIYRTLSEKLAVLSLMAMIFIPSIADASEYMRHDLAGSIYYGNKYVFYFYCSASTL